MVRQSGQISDSCVIGAMVDGNVCVVSAVNDGRCSPQSMGDVQLKCGARDVVSDNQIHDRAPPPPPPPPKSGFQTLHTRHNPGGHWSGGGTGGGNRGPGPCGANETGAHQGGAEETAET